jgi:hypothetical protein
MSNSQFDKYFVERKTNSQFGPLQPVGAVSFSV